MTGRRSMLAIVVALVALALRPPTATAHSGSLGRSIIAIDDDDRGAELRLTLTMLDLDALRAGLGDAGAVPAALVEGLALARGEVRCGATTPVELPAPAGHAAWRWRVRCPSPPDRVLGDLLVDVVPGHVHLARVIHHGRGAVVALAADRRVALLDRPAAVLDAPAAITLGFRHVVGGADHLLFLLTLLLVATTARELAIAATGFTAGHTLALVLAVALGARPAAAGIELLVAASIAVVAAEAAARRSGPAGRRVPLAVAVTLAALAALAAATGGPAPLALLGLALFAGCYLTGLRDAPPGHGRIAITTLFGLVHGFAFAGPLADLDLHGGALARALLGFNVGLELAQLVLLAAGWLILSTVRRRLPATAALVVDIATAAAMAPASYWIVTRAL